jgi:phosphate transport system protein
MKKFDEEIRILKQKLATLGDFALQMLKESVIAFKEQDLKLAAEVHDRRHKLNELDDEIDKFSFKLIALYNPMAGDARTVAAALKINTYLTRIGRYGKDIALVTTEIGTIPHFKKIVSIPQMFNIVVGMIHDALDAFQNGVTDRIADIAARDDEVDELRYSIFRECVSYMMENPRYITMGSHYIMIARYLERCGDHACKIAEKAYHMVTGKYIEYS